MKPRLEGTAAIVTGGGRGVGAEVARHLVEAGAAVGLIARSSDELHAVADEIAARGGRAVTAPSDVTDRVAIDAAVAQIERELGPTDLLVCNAGVSGDRPRPVWEIDADEWWRVQEINVLGTVHAVKAVVPGMVARRRGHVVHMASLIGARSEPKSSAYACSKASMIRFAEVLAADLEGTGVVSISISPGLVLTRMTRPIQDIFDLPAEQWTEARRAGKLIVRIAAGDADALAGTLVHVEDDLDALVARADEIHERGWYALRFVRGLESSEPV